MPGPAPSLRRSVGPTESVRAPRRSAAISTPSGKPDPDRLQQSDVVELQRLAGNQAVTSVVDRQTSVQLAPANGSAPWDHGATAGRGTPDRSGELLDAAVALA